MKCHKGFEHCSAVSCGSCFQGKESEWTTPFVGGDYQWLVEKGVGGRNLDARTRFFYLATGNTPAMILKMVGVGSQYVLANRDEKHQYLDGGKCYSLTLPPNVPVKDFWSLVVYDAQHRSMLQTPQLAPGRNSVRHPDMKSNSDGSITLWFAPKAPVGKETNWIQTTEGKTWFVCLRLYGPLDAWFNQTWRPSEIREEVEDRKRKGPPWGTPPTEGVTFFWLRCNFWYRFQAKKRWDLWRTWSQQSHFIYYINFEEAGPNFRWRAASSLKHITKNVCFATPMPFNL